MLRKINKIICYLKIIGLRGTFQSIVCALQKKEGRINVMGKNHRHPVALRLLTSDIPTYRQVFIDQEYDISLEAPPSTIVDAGANIGLSSIYFASKYPNAIIIALEPEDRNFSILEENVSQYPNITPLKKALWSSCGEISLVDPGLGHWGFMTQNKDEAVAEHSTLHDTVASLTVDRIIKDHNIGKIDILKVDIEGAEAEVFSDTSLWLDKVGTIIIELHENLKPGCQRSFYSGSNGFDFEWTQGENIFLSRKSEMHERPTKRH